MESINRFKIPTLLGLGIILLGIVVGVFLVLREQTFFSRASLDMTPKNVIISNITDDSVVISWQTDAAVASFITYGQNSPSEQTILDDRDTTLAKSYTSHFITIKKLLPQTTYHYKITSGKMTSNVADFKTALPATSQTGFTPVVGTVINGKDFLNEGIVYLSIAGAVTQSSLIKNSGNFLIPLSYVRKEDLSGTYPLTPDTIAKLTVVSYGVQTSALFKIQTASLPLPPIKVGENVDLSTSPNNNPVSTSSAKPVAQGNKFDLNKDGKVNNLDYAIVLDNFGKKGTNLKGDFDGNGIVDQKDLNLMVGEIKRLNSQ